MRATIVHMKKLTPGQAQVLDFVSETIFWIFPLVFAVLTLATIAQDTTHVSSMTRCVFVFLMYFTYGGVYIRRAIRYKRSKLDWITDSISAAICMVIGGLFFIQNSVVDSVAAIIFCALLALRRIPRLIQNHRPHRIVMSILIVAVLFVMAYVCIEPVSVYLFPPFMVMFLAVLHVIAISLSRMRLGVLIKIMRKTYAFELLFGLVALVAVFSLLFYTMEDGFPSYGDALWYSFAIVTTIGFGDFTVKSIIGRLLSVILGIYGLVVVAVITSVIVNFYSEVRSGEGLNAPKDEVEKQVEFRDPFEDKTEEEETKE